MTQTPITGWDRGVLGFATGAGFGFSPWAPGTVGALWGIPIAWALAPLALPLQLVILVVLYLVGIPLCTRAAQILDRKDPGPVVWDEFVTVPVVFLGVGAALQARIDVLLVGFVLHRIFDISKLWPMNWLEKQPGGLGIMSDDAVAGLYGCLVLHGLLALGLFG